MRIRMGVVALGLSLTGAALAGCGGGSDSGTSAAAPKFAGRYAGTFAGTVGGGPDSGTLSGTVAADGTLTGVAHDNGVNENATVTGTITSAGVLNSTFVYPGGVYTAKGVVTKSSSGHLIGTLTEFSGTTVIGTISVDLSPG